MFHHRDADARATAVHEGKQPRRQAARRDRAHHGLTDEFGGARVGAMGFHDDRATGREGRSRVAARDRERERKVARPKNNDRPERDQHAPQIGPRERLPLGQRRIDARIDPRTVSHDGGKQTELAAGARAFAGETREREAGLGVGALEERITERLDLGGDGLEELRPRGGGTFAVICKSLRRRLERGVDFAERGFVKIGRERFARSGIDRAKGRAAGGAGLAGEQTFSSEAHKIYAMELTSVPMGAMVMRTSSPLRSVKLSGGTTPVPVMR